MKSIQEGSNLLEYNYSGEEYRSQAKYTVGNGAPVILDYLADNEYRTEEIKRNGEKLATIQYNTNGVPKLVSYANGSSISIEYDRGRLLNYTLNAASTKEYDKYTFDFDANQNIKKVISNKGVTEYVYDTLNQLEHEILPDGTEISYEYDEVGNRTKKTILKAGTPTTIDYVYDRANQLKKVGNQDYEYDLNGNLKSDGTKNFIFNDFNQLMEIRDLSDKTIASYTYDESGKRKSTTTSQGTIHYYYDGDQVLYETDGNNQVLREYTYDDNGQPLTMTTNGKTYYYLVNYHGDVIALIDTAGNEVASYTYDAWGNILTQDGPMAEENPYRYARYRYDESTKLYYLMARYYNPVNGRFLSVDPIKGDIEAPLSLNGYSYVSNNPVNFDDTTGTFRNPLTKIIKGAIYVWVSVKVTVMVGGQFVKKQVGKWVIRDTGKLSAKDIVFSDKFKKPAYKNQVAQRGWTNDSIAKTINNPYKIDTSVNKYTGNPVTIYFKDKTHYVAVDNGTGKVIQVSNRNKADWKFDSTFSK